MDDMMIIKLVFGIMLTIGSVVLFIITFKFWFKSMIQEKRCTKEVEGIVSKYTFANKGPENSGVHLPVISYYVNSKEYNVVGPEYRRIKVTQFSSPTNNNTMMYKEDGQNLTIRRSSNAIIGISKNPCQEMYPLNSHIKVYYDPNNPKLSYVKRYCNKRFAFWIGFTGGLFCLISDVLTLLLL